MVTQWSLSEFAALVGRSEEEVGRWRADRLVDPVASGRFDELDLVRWLWIHAGEEEGFDPEELPGAIKSGEVRRVLSEYLYPDGPSLSVEEAAERAGISAADARALRTALGLTREALLERDVETLGTFKAIANRGVPWEAVLEAARVYGDALRRLGETAVRVVHVHIHERLEAAGVGWEEITRRITPLTETVLPLLDRVVEDVHRQHLLQAWIEDAYLHLPSATAHEQGTVETTIAFIDLASFTELAQTKGDRAAMHTLSRLDSTVRLLAPEHDGKLVKQIGDALMLAFRHPAAAAAFAHGVLDAVGRDPDMPALHIGMHAGPAIYSGGDYIGTTVNTASRVTSAAAAGEVLMTEGVAEQLDDGEAAEPVGVRMLRGVESPVRLFRLIVPEEQRDPVCGKLDE
jgi:adenylate cyclase